MMMVISFKVEMKSYNDIRMKSYKGGKKSYNIMGNLLFTARNYPRPKTAHEKMNVTTL